MSRFDALIYSVLPSGTASVVDGTADDGVAYVRLPRMLNATHEAVMGVLGQSATVVWFEDGVNPVSGLPQRLYATMADVAIEAGQREMATQSLWDRLGERSVARSTAEMLGKLRYLGGFAELGHEDLRCEQYGGKTRAVATSAELHVERGAPVDTRGGKKSRVTSLLALERLVDAVSMRY
jgi:hypothetical protein